MSLAVRERLPRIRELSAETEELRRLPDINVGELRSFDLLA
jgi:hypothetical protein